MLETARYQWEAGTRTLESARAEGARYRELMTLVEAVSGELRRRVGQTFTLGELAEAYEDAEDWVREVVVQAAPPPSRTGVRDAALVQDAAFGLYARGATDYRP